MLQQFERLFQFARRIEDLMYTITPEEVSVLVIVSYYAHNLLSMFNLLAS